MNVGVLPPSKRRIVKDEPIQMEIDDDQPIKQQDDLGKSIKVETKEISPVSSNEKGISEFDVKSNLYCKVRIISLLNGFSLST